MSISNLLVVLKIAYYNLELQGNIVLHVSEQKRI